MKKIAVLIPCYNEQMTIAKVIADFKAVLPEADIYVYDNNSVDKTIEVAQNAGAIVREEHRQGKGNVVRTMFREIDADCYLMVDGDGSHPAKYARQMCDMVLQEGVDMVTGDRLNETYFEHQTRAFHGFGNRLVRGLINKIFNANVKDIMSGYRALSRPFVKHIPILSKGFELETEMTIHALDKNFYIKDISVEFVERPMGSVSAMNTYTDGIKVLLTIMRLFRDYRPFMFFSYVALLFLLVSFAMFLPVFSDWLHTGLVPRFPTLIVSVTMAILGFLFFFCEIVLEVLVKKHRQLFEILMNK